MSAKRLLFVVNDAAFFVSHRLVLAVAARDAGYDVHVATGPGVAASATIAATGVTHHVLPLSRSGTHPLGELKTVAAIASLYRSLAPDIVHLVTIKPVIYGGLLARLLGVKRVVAAISGFGFVFISRGLLASVRRRVVIALYGAALRHPKITMVFQNPQDRAEMLRHVGLDERNTVLITGSGVHLEQFGPPMRGDVPVVVMAARLLGDKGVREYISAAESLHARGVAARFQLAGTIDPGNRASITDEEVAEWRARGVVECLGHTTDIAGLFQGADIVVLPSYREGLPKVLLEAAAASSAVITTDVPGCRDAIVPGETGLLVPARDATALATAMEQLVQDRARCARMGAAGRRLAEDRFSVQLVIEQHLAVYRQLGGAT